LTAASLMVSGPAAADAVARARRLPNLRVGLHVVVVEGEPTLDRAQIPGLIDRDGRLRNDLARLGVEIALSPSLRRQASREIVAQFEAYRATGLPLDHVDAHRHYHLHPSIAAMIIATGRRFGMRALRVPFEPRRIVVEIDPGGRHYLGLLVAPAVKRLRNRVHRAGLKTTDAVFGLAWSGAMTAERLRALVPRLPPGFVEIYLHPGTMSAFPGAAPGYRYAEEFRALCEPDIIAAVRASGYTTGGYADAPAAP
jgi:hopanoid biosynthesis associated protein HpnK